MSLRFSLRQKGAQKFHKVGLVPHQNLCHCRALVRIGYQYIENLKSTELNLSRLVLQQVHLNFQTFWIRLIPEHDSEYAESVVKHLIQQSEKLLLRDKVLADELLVEHVEKVVKVLLKELIRENLVPE